MNSEDHSLESRRMLYRLEDTIEEQIESSQGFIGRLIKIRDLIVMAREAPTVTKRKEALSMAERKFRDVLSEAKFLSSESRREFKYTMKGNSPLP